MSELTDLYQEMILDHNRNPRNFQELAGANRILEGFNPLCGDRLKIFIKSDGPAILEISFLGSGCALSKASSSLMTIAVKGKSREEVQGLYEKFHAMVTGQKKKEDLGKLNVFSGVSEFPVRVKCATLPWHTLLAALEGKDETVSTEAPEEALHSGTGFADERGGG